MVALAVELVQEMVQVVQEIHQAQAHHRVITVVILQQLHLTLVVVAVVLVPLEQLRQQVLVELVVAELHHQLLVLL
jgi:uncharacterized membrane protein YqhA